MIDFEELATDGSWRLTWSGDRLDGAVFRLDADTTAERGALVARLGADASDPNGGRITSTSWLHKGFVDDSANGLWGALPALRELTAEGGLLFDDIDGDALPALAPSFAHLTLKVTDGADEDVAAAFAIAD